MSDDTRIRPFRIAIPQSALDDLRERLARTRWLDADEESAGWTYGIYLGYMRELMDHWQRRYDWRIHEATLNRFAQFKADVDGVGIHLIHERGKGPNPTPLLLLHGFPDSFYRYHYPVRDLLYRLLLGCWPQVKDAYAAAKREWRDDSAPRGRTRDKWLPLYTMVQLAGDAEAVNTVKQMAAEDPYETKKSRADSPDAYLLMFAGWLVAMAYAGLTVSAADLWEGFTDGEYDTSKWANAVGLSLDVSYLKRNSGPTRLARELLRLHLCTRGEGRDRRKYVFDRETVMEKVRAALGDEAVVDCAQAEPRYEQPRHYRQYDGYRIYGGEEEEEVEVA